MRCYTVLHEAYVTSGCFVVLCEATFSPTPPVPVSTSLSHTCTCTLPARLLARLPACLPARTPLNAHVCCHADTHACTALRDAAWRPSPLPAHPFPILASPSHLATRPAPPRSFSLLPPSLVTFPLLSRPASALAHQPHHLPPSFPPSAPTLHPLPSQPHLLLSDSTTHHRRHSLICPDIATSPSSIHCQYTDNLTHFPPHLTSPPRIVPPTTPHCQKEQHQHNCTATTNLSFPPPRPNSPVTPTAPSHPAFSFPSLPPLLTSLLLSASLAISARVSRLMVAAPAMPCCLPRALCAHPAPANMCSTFRKEKMRAKWRKKRMRRLKRKRRRDRERSK
jgi:hypothetical protein